MRSRHHTHRPNLRNESGAADKRNRGWSTDCATGRSPVQASTTFTPRMPLPLGMETEVNEVLVLTVAYLARYFILCIMNYDELQTESWT